MFAPTRSIDQAQQMCTTSVTCHLRYRPSPLPLKQFRPILLLNNLTQTKRCPRIIQEYTRYQPPFIELAHKYYAPLNHIITQNISTTKHYNFRNYTSRSTNLVKIPRKSNNNNNCIKEIKKFSPPEHMECRQIFGPQIKLKLIFIYFYYSIFKPNYDI